MNIEITIVGSNNIVDNIQSNINTLVMFNFIDITTMKGKKKGWALKSHWGAKLDPFILITKNNVPIKAFYSEDKKDIINETIKYLNTL